MKRTSLQRPPLAPKSSFESRCRPLPRIKESRLPEARYIWKIFFAAAALGDIAYTLYPIQANEEVDICPLPNDNHTNIAIHQILTQPKRRTSWIGPLFCTLCLIEALLRSCDARRMALHNTALDELEKQMLKFARRSGRRFSRMFGDALTNDKQRQNEKTSFIDRWMKFNRRCWTWIPALATFAFWVIILPTETEDFRYPCGSMELNDSAIMTQWLVLVARSLVALSVSFGEFVDRIIWTRVIPYRIHKHPQRFLKRLNAVFKGIRYVRFAGPLARMGLKLQDQLRTMWKSRSQSYKSKQRKERHINSPSLIFADIQKLKSLAKIQTSLARIPSFTMSSPALENIASTVKESYIKRRADAKRIAGQISKLHEDFLGGGGAAADIYDRIVDTTNELTNSLKRDGSLRNRYLMSPRSLFSSPKYLISPRTRFSLSWRITVTNCLMLEIFRLCASWHLSETFSISLSQVVAKLLVECKFPEKNKNLLVFLSDRINEVRGNVFDMLPILGAKPVDIAVCLPSSGTHAALILQFGLLLERFIDTVVFLDIFVWFFTGDIDIDTHQVIPKPFITRCIIPGTLVQVLDHPTLPTLLPNMLKTILRVSKTIGYSRVIRWILATAPAVFCILLEPLKKFMFGHIKKDEGIMRYAESVGMLSPERKVVYGSASNLRLGVGSPSGFFRRLSSTTLNNASQVGLAFDMTPEPSRQDLQSLVPTEASFDSNITTSGESVAPLVTPHRPGILHHSINLEEHPALIPMARSPSKNRRSVHFGFLDTDLTNE